ncbi:MAG: DUF3536 domain-containing protein [bacterium]|nr:DUF3536 domain-containing protein [bacterium]
MEEQNNEKNLFAVIHGHFYQPPRENPWTETVEVEKSAFPYHDWNEKITYECYIPNALAKIKDEKGKILNIINNYSYISFNFGPTLLSYLEKNFPKEYKRIIRADKDSIKKNNGHGNALCQAYNHIILPLANYRDKATQIKWGVNDFKYRFGRMPEGMWLPEAAVNMEVINILIEEDIKFIILSPYQAKRICSLDKKEWIDVSRGRIDPKMPYRIFSKTQEKEKNRTKYLEVFFYDGSTAKAVAFESLLISSKMFLEKIKSCFVLERNHQLFNIATDGESYGHHKIFGELCLAYLVSHELPRNNIKVTNYGHFLEMYPPKFEVEIEEGEGGRGSSWSCFHGVERWISDCGCTTGSKTGWNQQWRKPLREALDALRDELINLFEEIGSIYLKNIWEARNDYIGIILNRNKRTISKFFKRHLKFEISKEEKVKVLKLLEIQRNAMFMYTSCGWFFADISGIETVQNLKYALRIIQLARDLGKVGLEGRFLAHLKHADSNLSIYKNGLDVYRRLVVPAMATLEKIVAQFSILLLFNSQLSGNFYHYMIEVKNIVKKKLDMANVFAGLVKVTDGIVLETKSIMFFIVYLPDCIVQAYVKIVKDEREYEILKDKIDLTKREDILNGFKKVSLPLFGRKHYTLNDLFMDQREAIFSMIIKNKMDKLGVFNEDILEEYLPIAKEAKKLSISISLDIKNELEVALNYKINQIIDLMSKSFERRLFIKLQEIANEAFNLELKLNYNIFQSKLQDVVQKKLLELKDNFTIENIYQIIEIAKFAKTLDNVDWNHEIENIIFDLINKKQDQILKSKSKVFIDAFRELVSLMGFNINKINI